MFIDKRDKRVFHIREGNIEDAYAFVTSLLSRQDINKITADETLLIFEALMQSLVDWGLDEDTDLDISCADMLGDFRIRIGFEGKVFAFNDKETRSIENQILDAYEDKLDYSYRSGYNAITISVSRSNNTSFLACAIASLCAVILYIPFSHFIDTSAQKHLLDAYVLPIETMYTNALLMVGAPMTLFSLLKNLTDTFVLSQRHSGVRQLQVQTLVTSVLSVLLAFLGFFLLSITLLSDWGASSAELGSAVNRTFAEVVTSFVPSNILEPFQTISPIPLMVVALLSTYALCSAGKYFDFLRHAMMACYTLFSRMLHVLIAMLPVFCFLSILDVLLDAGIEWVALDLFCIIAIYLGFILLFATYTIRLRARGIKVIPFVRTLIPLLAENARIGSAINAAPYNIRYCARNFKMNKTMLENDMPVLAEINLDGNCFILTSIALIFVFTTDTYLLWVGYVGLGLLVLFLSYGAPNQPGSILIGTLLLTMYLDSFDVVCLAIFCEAFLGSAQNLINVIGDIVMVAVEDSKQKAALAGE